MGILSKIRSLLRLPDEIRRLPDDIREAVASGVEQGISDAPPLKVDELVVRGRRGPPRWVLWNVALGAALAVLLALTIRAETSVQIDFATVPRTVSVTSPAGTLLQVGGPTSGQRVEVGYFRVDALDLSNVTIGLPIAVSSCEEHATALGTSCDDNGAMVLPPPVSLSAETQHLEITSDGLTEVTVLAEKGLLQLGVVGAPVAVCVIGFDGPFLTVNSASDVVQIDPSQSPVACKEGASIRIEGSGRDHEKAPGPDDEKDPDLDGEGVPAATLRLEDIESAWLNVSGSTLSTEEVEGTALISTAVHQLSPSLAVTVQDNSDHVSFFAEIGPRDSAVAITGGADSMKIGGEELVPTLWQRHEGLFVALLAGLAIYLLTEFLRGRRD